MTDDSLIAVALADGVERMHKVVEHTKADFATVRTGRASPALVEKIKVDYYGSEVPLQQIAGFSVPEPRVLVVNPYDKGAMKAIEKALNTSDLGINPSNDGQVIRLVFPELNEERRKEFVKVVKHRAEEGRVAVRNVRRAARHDLEATGTGRGYLVGRAGSRRKGAREADPRTDRRDRQIAEPQGAGAARALSSCGPARRHPSRAGSFRYRRYERRAGGAGSITRGRNFGGAKGAARGRRAGYRAGSNRRRRGRDRGRTGGAGRRPRA